MRSKALLAYWDARAALQELSTRQTLLFPTVTVCARADFREDTQEVGAEQLLGRAGLLSRSHQRNGRTRAEA